MNQAGVIPVIFASSMLYLPVLFVTLSNNQGAVNTWVQTHLVRGSGAWYAGLFFALTVFFTYFYVAITFNSDDIADNMKKYGGFINTFSKAIWRPIAHRIIEALQQSVTMDAATIVHIDPELWQRGWQLFTERPDKDWGLTDCFSFIVMKDYGVKQAFTADRHFEQAGFVRLLK